MYILYKTAEHVNSASMAEWYEALVLDTSLIARKSSYPTFDKKKKKKKKKIF